MSDSLPNMLEFRNLSKVFPGVRALDGITFNVKVGEIHGLVGENGAGKSTLIKILCGVHKADSGSILINNEDIQINNPNDAQQVGIQVMHQEINVIPNMTVAENMFIHNLPRKVIGFVSDREMNKLAEESLQLIGLEHISANERMGNLSLAEQQMVNLARIVSTNPRIVLLDEPTASLTQNETHKLFEVVSRFRALGISVIYISHYIEEVKIISDRITILRDGKYITTVNAKETTSKEIIREMVGKEVVSKKREKNNDGEKVLSLECVSTANKIKNISLMLRKGEVLGLYGLNGSGKTEVLRAILGVDKVLAGKIQLASDDITKHNMYTHLSKGITYAPEDRRRQGLVLPMNVKQNISLGNELKTSKAIFINDRNEQVNADKFIEKMNIRTPSQDTTVSLLSGGNQQKVILARCLGRNSKVLLLDEPTVGIDVGAREEIYELISEISSSENSVIVASSDINEILEICDRIYVLLKGRIVAEMDRKDATEQNLLIHAIGESK